MRLTEKQFAKIEHLMPTPRRKPEVSNYDFLCALLYIIENGCKWRALPNEYGNWHTIYVRFNRWCKSGVIDRIFETLQEENIIEIRTEIICIDSTSIKVHPDAAGARKSSGEQSIGRVQKGAHNKDSFGFHVFEICNDFSAFCRKQTRCSRRKKTYRKLLF